MIESKKLSVHEIMSAIATAVYSCSEFDNSKRLNTYEKEKDKPYWLECVDPISAVKCKFKDDKLILIFTEEITNPLKLTNSYVNKIDDKVDQIVSYLKKKYKEITNSTLNIKPASDIMERVHPLSLVRQIRDYTIVYKIVGIDSVKDQNDKEVKELLKSAIDKAEEMTSFKKKG